MNHTAAKSIFWFGTLSSLILFIILTVDTHGRFEELTRADKLNDQVVAGKRAFEKHNCNDCHTILGFGAYYAPDLTRAYARLGEDAIKRRLASPDVVFADSFRKMPQQHLSEKEIADITAFLEWVSNIQNHDWPPQHSEHRWKRSTERMLSGAALSPAAALIEQENCMSCHRLGDKGGRTGPRLEWIGARHDSQWIADFLASPPEGVVMPSFDYLSREQRLMIGDFLVSLAASSKVEEFWRDEYSKEVAK
jgi:nitric oxide reductase subunit C